jgi:hypothetical protein
MFQVFFLRSTGVWKIPFSGQKGSIWDFEGTHITEIDAKKQKKLLLWENNKCESEHKQKTWKNLFAPICSCVWLSNYDSIMYFSHKSTDESFARVKSFQMQIVRFGSSEMLRQDQVTFRMTHMQSEWSDNTQIIVMLSYYP